MQKLLRRKAAVTKAKQSAITSSDAWALRQSL